MPMLVTCGFWWNRLKIYIFNRIGGVMVSVLAWSVVDRGFEPRSGQKKKDKKTNDGILNTTQKIKDWATRQQVSNIMFIVREFLWLSTFHYVLYSNFRSEFSCVGDSNRKSLTWLVLRMLTLLFLLSMFRSISFPSRFPCL